MRWPWERVTRSETETERAEAVVLQARSHIRVLVNELEQTLDRIADKAERLGA